MVYSTCSLAAKEDENLANHALRKRHVKVGGGLGLSSWMEAGRKLGKAGGKGIFKA